MAMKGFQTVAAMILVSELGEVHRFAHPRQVMAYLGLVPTENTSSDNRRQGRITKLATGRVRPQADAAMPTPGGYWWSVRSITRRRLKYPST
jgi:transposase